MAIKGIITGKVSRPSRIIVYGVHGVGKTSLAASAPNPILVQTEDGADQIGVARFPLAKTWQDFMGNLAELLSEEHEFKTAIIDSLDFAERLCMQYVCNNNHWQSIEEPGYGKGYVVLAEAWREFLDIVNDLRDAGISVIMLAHAQIRVFNDPSLGSWDRYEVALHKHTGPKAMENADAVFFMTYQLSTETSKDGRKITRGTGNGRRVLYTEERPAAVAKSRYQTPYKIALPDDPNEGWAQVAQYL